jgi:endonuclease-8
VPEGDTIHRAAARLAPALTGAVVERFTARAPRPHPRRGERIERVEAKGKHLLVHFDGGLVLDTHLGMTGRWDLYPTGATWRKPAHLARAVIEVDGWTAVCFAAPTVRLSAAPAVGHLGPDLCDADADLDEAVRRMCDLESSTVVADALLDQRVCAGVGNFYASEVCFVCRVNPLTPIGSVDRREVERLVTTAARLLRSNLDRPSRSTVGGRSGAVAVYGRARQPCRRCGTPIVAQRTGRHRRTSYWCPRCQPDPMAQVDSMFR